MNCIQGMVAARQVWGPGEVVLRIKAPELTAEAVPGQFVMVRAGEVFLRRAISIHYVSDGCVELAVQAVGRGTEWLCRQNVGDVVDLIGPLGNGFDCDIYDSRVMIVAGGIGKAPFRWLVERLEAQGNELIFICGGRNAEALAGLECYERCSRLSLQLATEDGSCGHQGYVTALMDNLAEMDRIYACGPTPMLKAVQKMAIDAKVPCQLSLEGKMACGVGVCLGCTCRRADETLPYAKVCDDGPVFWAEEVVLDG